MLTFVCTQVMHPLLIHAVNDARRVTFHVSSDPQMGPRWTAVQVCAPHIPQVLPTLYV